MGILNTNFQSTTIDFLYFIKLKYKKKNVKIPVNDHVPKYQGRDKDSCFDKKKERKGAQMGNN